MLAVAGAGSAEPLPTDPAVPETLLVGPETRTMSATDGNRTFAARVPKAVAAGEPIRIDAELRNTGKGVVIVDVSNLDFPPVRFTVRTAAGEPVPLTQFGESVIGTGHLKALKLRGGSPIGFPIGQNDSIPFSIPNLALYYDLTLPGKYTVTVSRTFRIGENLRDAKYPELAAGPIPFSVTRHKK